VKQDQVLDLVGDEKLQIQIRSLDEQIAGLRAQLAQGGAVRFKPILLTVLVVPAIYVVLRDPDGSQAGR
jgi:hypothetical protein